MSTANIKRQVYGKYGVIVPSIAGLTYIIVENTVI